MFTVYLGVCLSSLVFWVWIWFVVLQVSVFTFHFDFCFAVCVCAVLWFADCVVELFCVCVITSFLVTAICSFVLVLLTCGCVSCLLSWTYFTWWHAVGVWVVGLVVLWFL